MAAAAVIRPILYLADDVVWVQGPSGAIRVPDDPVRHCLDCIDDDTLLLGAQILATVDVLAAAIHRAIGTVSGGTEFVPELTVAHPSHWGMPRRGVFEAAARRCADDVAMVPAALVVPVPSSGTRWIVLECAALSTTATVVELDRHGAPNVVSCALAPETGTLDLSEDPAQVTVIDRLVRDAADGRSIEAVYVIGTAADDVLGILTTGIGSTVVSVPPATMVERRSEAQPTDQQDRTASWVSPGPTRTPAPPHRRWHVPPATVAVVVAATIGVAVAVAVALWPVRAPDVSGRTEPLERFEIGSASMHLPEEWGVRAAEPGRLELVPDGVSGRRIVVISVDVAAGSDRVAIARTLERRIVERGPDGPFSGFDPEKEFAGRVGVSYLETPDDQSSVRWHVLVENDLQMSVGCQFREGEWESLAADCEQAVRSIEVASN
ncbi:type VII secretion-associated protein [Rhodococcus xishaensis]|uniref:Type VII secretion-associated protein n=1 Tax=Rhodococcus xishaensis TaxID=2487364 RepID=A0A3S3AP12_9NOCA|nr:type VII secretion-associated protein [Rhodococcus xishaensis]RVW05114.1 type VII secretion-associated protein [Rhodococcus xishaensis]